jgi:cytochrome b
MQTESAKNVELDFTTRLLHFGLMVTGVLAWISGFGADDYKLPHHAGFTLHRWLGMGLTLCLGARFLYGIVGPPAARFSRWVPYTRERLKLVGEDLLNLLRLTIPDRPARVGLAGLVETFGLLAFSWMAVTGSLMFFYLGAGHKTRGMVHAIKEVHETGQVLVAVFLGIHVGAVLLHALLGDPRWRNLWPWGKPGR